MTSRRLDEELVARGLLVSRARAKDAIARALVRVDGAPARKPAQPVTAQSTITVDAAANHYVSRAAFKLLHGLDHFAISVEGRHCLDLGASTGGFTQVLLERGAAHVLAVDVGHGQMAPAIATDLRVSLLQGLNARDITADHVAQNMSLIVCDVSFISLKLALMPTLDLATPGTVLVALIKPQFEVGREALGKGGVVRDLALLETVCAGISRFIVSQGWRVNGVVASPIDGSDGNKEFLLAAEKL